MSRKLQVRYKQYCADMKIAKEPSLTYVSWMELKLQALMDFRDKIEPCSICAGYMLKRDKKRK